MPEASPSVTSPGERTSPGFILALLAAAVYLCYLLLRPFLQPILVALALALLSFPMHRWLRSRVRNRNAVALISTLAVILFAGLVTFFIGRAFIGGLRDVYESLTNSSENRERLGVYLVQVFEKAAEVAGRYLQVSSIDLRKAVLENTEKWLNALLVIAPGAIRSLTAPLTNLGIAFFILFFLFRDGEAMLRRAAVVLPIRREHGHRLVATVRDTLNAIVYGTFFIAILQGALAGLAFWLLGVASPVLWAVVTCLCALLPVIGTTIVILPAISMLIVSGHWIKAIVLLIWGIVVVHPIDNFVRPYLIGGRTRLSTLFVFFSLIGGLAAFGGAGLVVGPVVFATAVSLFQILREELRLHPRI